MEYLLLILFILIGRLLQVWSHFLIYEKIDWKKFYYKGYPKDKWILYCGDLLSIMFGYYLLIQEYTIGFYIVDIILIFVLMMTYMTDVREKLILDIFTYPAIILMFISRFFIVEYYTWVYILGGVLVGLILLVLMLTMKDKLGGGDFKLFIALGFYFGFFDIVLLLIISASFGLLYALPKLIISKKNEAIPFGPFIVLGCWILMMFDLTFLFNL